MRNDYEIRGDTVAIFVNGKGSTHEALIDLEDLPKALQFEGRWYADYFKSIEGFYVKGTLMKNRKAIRCYLHRHIIGSSVDKHIDHINHDTFDNRKSNLRSITQSENNQNRKGATKLNKCGIRGVTWDKKMKKWHVQVTVNKKRVFNDFFDNMIDAETAAQKAREIYMPFSLEAMEAVV